MSAGATYPRNPRLAVRRFCLICQGDAPSAVRACADAACALWPWRLSEAPKEPEAARAALRAVRRQCLACAGSRAEVRTCAAREACPLWHWRFGVRPQTYRAVRRRFFAPKPLRLL
ncbi:hypothetical protein [Desulfovibrio legallii]|uniref:Uncharacterized protein n=1 Tax=Desulfovibrio legallii TaxID=571438 RepID=A0A1G7IVK6_9BACT|nr:hypothetical protein [Desulfovibrio legallii]SDF16638.1 hypothetical protein SAMN05192586_10286 [Desulfovibrio legallii]